MTTHRVVMRSTLTGPDGAPVVHEAVDPRVPDDQIETYLYPEVVVRDAPPVIVS